MATPTEKVNAHVHGSRDEALDQMVHATVVPDVGSHEVCTFTRKEREQACAQCKLKTLSYVIYRTTDPKACFVDKVAASSLVANDANQDECGCNFDLKDNCPFLLSTPQFGWFCPRSFSFTIRSKT